MASATCSYIGIEEGTTMREFLKDMKDDIETPEYTEVTNVQIFTSDGIWQRPKNLISLHVRAVGAGGSGANSPGNRNDGFAGGGGGHMSEKVISLPDDILSVSVTVGKTSASPSSFGTYLTASGGSAASGYAGGSGGSGGGGGKSGSGGSGSYGGGGGGGGAYSSGNVGGAGGRGGIYGGGGGGAGGGGGYGGRGGNSISSCGGGGGGYGTTKLTANSSYGEGGYGYGAGGPGGVSSCAPGIVIVTSKIAKYKNLVY